MSVNSLPDNHTNVNIKRLILDPLSVIIKLAIIGNKPVGSKVLIHNNVVYIQEPGMFQAVCRIFFHSNKTDLQYMYNPIQIACNEFLSKEFTQKTPRIKQLFVCAQTGLKRLMETYQTCTIIHHCLNYYFAIITNHLEQKYNDHLFFRDGMTSIYTKEITDALNQQWTDEKIKIVLDIIVFLMKDTLAANNVKSLENIMDNIDRSTQTLTTGIL
jgi:hypothetical protein